MKKLIILLSLFIGINLNAQTPEHYFPLSQWSTLPGVTLISGDLVVGVTYRIGTYESGDDFANVGGVNETGSVFIATNVTPDDWSNESALKALDQRTVDVQHGYMGVANDVWNTQDELGSGKRSIGFDGVSDEIELGNIGSGDIYSGIIRFYTATDITSVNTGESILTMSGTNDGAITLGSLTGAFNHELITIGSTSNASYWADISATIPAGWNVIAYSWDGSKYQIYLNGIAKTTAVLGTPILRPADNVYIGSWNGDKFFNGEMSNVEFFNYAVSADSIASWSTKIAAGTFKVPFVDQGADNAELISNGGAESGDPPTDWIATRGTLSRSNEQAHSGTYSAKVVHDNVESTTFIRATSVFNIQVGDRVAYSGWAYNIDEADFNIVMYVNGISQADKADNTTGVWTKLFGDFISTETGTLEARMFTNGDSEGGGIVYWDDISAVRLGSTLSLSADGMYQNTWIDQFSKKAYPFDGPKLILSDKSNLGAMFFDGMDSKVLALTDARFNGLGDKTIVGRFYATGWGESNFGRLLSDGKFLVNVRANDRNMGILRDGSSPALSNDDSIILNAWIFFAIVTPADGNNVQFWISNDGNNPTNQTADAIAATPEDGGNLYIGNRADGDLTFSGAISYIEIYNLLLTEDEILSKFQEKQN